MQDITFSVQLKLGKRKNDLSSEEAEKIEIGSDMSGLEKWLNTAQQIVRSIRKKH